MIRLTGSRDTIAVNPDKALNRPIRVFMMDLLSIVPYYTGHLCEALQEMEEVSLEVGAITYYLDPLFFTNKRLQLRPGFLNASSKLRTSSPLLRRLSKSCEYLLNLVALLVRFLFARPDIIHAQFLPLAFLGIPFEIWFLRIARRLGIKIVYTVHNLLPQDTAGRHRPVCRTIYGLSDRLVCHGERTKQQLAEEFGVHTDRVSVIAHGPLFSSRAPSDSGQARKQLGISCSQHLVLWQGILRPYKGVSFLLKAWKELKATNASACLAIVGPGEHGLTEEIVSEVSSLGLSSSVKLELRFVPVDELMALYDAADVIVYPYREGTTSGALMTGINYAKAIVATKIPAFQQVLRDGEDALLVEYGNVGELAQAIGRLLDDASLRLKLGWHLRETNARFPQWPRIAIDTLRCYELAVNS